MSAFINKTFDDVDTEHLHYAPGGFFNHGTWNASRTGTSGTLSTSNVPFDANVTFETPSDTIAFYYYGMKRSRGSKFGVCIDCDQNELRFEIFDAVDPTDDGKNPPELLFSKHFEIAGTHRIILRNEPDDRFPGSNSQIAIDRFEVEIPNPNPAVTTIVTAANPTSTSQTDTSPQSSGTNTGAIIGGVIGGLAVILLILAMCYWWWRKRRSKEQALRESEAEVIHPSLRPSAFEAQHPTPAAFQRPTRPAGSKGRGYLSSSQGRSSQSGLHASRPSLGNSDLSGSLPTTESWQRGGSRPMREVDAGPAGGRVRNEDEETLPPEYEQVVRRSSFAARVRPPPGVGK